MRSRNWLLADLSISLSYVSRIERTRGELVAAFPIEGAVSLETIASGGGRGHVELEELSTELCAAGVAIIVISVSWLDNDYFVNCVAFAKFSPKRKRCGRGE